MNFESLEPQQSWLDYFYSLFSKVLRLFSTSSQMIQLKHRNFKIIKKLGEGGFSFVYLVSDGARDYALKQVRIQLSEQAEDVKREIEAHQMVNSPHVIKLLDHVVLPSVGLLLLPYYQQGTVPSTDSDSRFNRSPTDSPQSNITIRCSNM